MNTLTWQDFEMVDMRVGTIVDATVFSEARNPSYILHVDFGNELGVLKSSAQITTRYSVEDILGKQIVAVVNFPKKQIGPMMSECLVLGAVDGKYVTLLHPGFQVANGLKIS